MRTQEREKVSEDPSPVVFSTKSSWSYDMMSCCTASFCWSHHKQTNITKTDRRGKHVTSDLATYSSMSSNLYAECYILHVKSLVLLSFRQVKVYTGKLSSKNFLWYSALLLCGKRVEKETNREICETFPSAETHGQGLMLYPPHQYCKPISLSTGPAATKGLCLH